MAMKPCPRCKRLIPQGLAYCEQCKPVVLAQMAEAKERKARRYNKTYNKQRDPKYKAFYNGKAWRTTSEAKLQSCGWKCEAKLEGCQGRACEVHHIEPLRTPGGWGRRLDWSNLQGVCTACHNKLDEKNFRKKLDDCVIDLKKLRN